MGLKFHHVQPGALNSSVPELFFSTEHVPRVNAAFKLATTAYHTAGHCPGWAFSWINISGLTMPRAPLAGCLLFSILLAVVASRQATLFLIVRA